MTASVTRKATLWACLSCRTSVFLPVIFALLVAFPAQAGFKVQQEHALPKSRFKEKPLASPNAPVMLAADEVDYDHENDVVTATGHVEVSQGDTILLADLLIYDQANNEVEAHGHVSMLQPSGDVYFADVVELQDDMKAGIIRNFKARLSDNSLFVANGARKIDEDHIELFKAAYTPCKCFTDSGKPKKPLWQIRAADAMIAQDDQEVRYKDAQFALWGTPVMYTPYFSHPTPGAENESGLLMPEFMHNDNLGTVYKQPVYYSIAPDKDITFLPIFTTHEGPVMAGEYRQMFDAGPLQLDGSITRPQNRDASGDSTAGHETRGHIDARGIFKIDENYDWGFDAHRTTDETYLRRYGFSNDTLLTSRIYGEGFNFIGGGDRTYARIQGLAFQGLTGQDDPNRIPIVAPLTDFTWQSDPGIYNSRITADANAMVLYRKIGAESRRLSGTLGWKLPYISSDGQVIEFTTRLRTDIYDVNDVTLENGRNFNGVTGREIPEASLLWRYPFINRWQDSSLMLEPVAEFTISPGGGNPQKIPNEDSLLPEFTDTNLFASDRFAGLDRVENGPRLSYGVRGQAQFYSDKYVDWLFGQHYRVDNDRNFPFSNDLTSHFSDYVGKVGLTYNPFAIAYRFRLDRQDWAPKRNEIDTGYNAYPLTMSAAYVQLKNDPILATKEVITGTAGVNLTENWIWNLGGSRDLHLGQTDTATTGLTFKNECINVTGMVGKDYTDLRDIKPSLTFWFAVSLKNLD